uniref:Iron complex transport system ATP-binding protein n=1 Tax=Candidatus Kentrum sp. TUN TaxID=2126343 RepID=A0A450ZG05_9GAMM|nr:MAG: iron complex transport system ATP-binding protein [Candidatus Kentron sp. TUN]VFK53331.1 MAG: iron complex transport system ATP-binding protein [Candidatus Kentron sp. TUN]VFK58666.1 MAG: iron complex transport system ATP-binding protein [Candidatus Kentron sp. TUN]
MELRTENLTLTIGGKTIVRHLNMTASKGQCWAILGRNGVGKTTLIRCLAGLGEPDSGTIHLDGISLVSLPRRQVARRLGVLFQQGGNAFPFTVWETVVSGRYPHLSAWQSDTEQDWAVARQALRIVELDGYEQRTVETLSGGERRRLDLAVVLTQDPVIFLLDEPANHLDLRYQILLLKHMRHLAHERGKTILMALHDMNLAARFCDHALLLYGSGRTDQGPLDLLFHAERLTEVYGYPVRSIAHDGQRYWFPG